MLLSWTKLEDIILGEINQSQKDKYSYDSLKVPRLVKFIETERMMAAKGYGEEKTGSCLWV